MPGAFAAAVERQEHIESLDRFVAELPERVPVFTLVTTGLLNVLSACLTCIPETVPLVIVGSDLSRDEVNWVARTGRTFHHVPVPVDMNTVLQSMYRHCSTDFAWIDIDCLVLDPTTLDVLRAPARNAARGYYAHHEFGHTTMTPMLRTCLVCVSRDAADRLTAIYPQLDPTVASPHATTLGRFDAERASARVLSAEELAALRGILSLDVAGVLEQPQAGVLDVYAGEAMHLSVGRDSAPRFVGADRQRVSCLFDVLIVYQLLARAHEMAVTLLDDRGGRLVHFGAIARARRNRGPLGRSRHFDTLCFDAMAARAFLRSGAPAAYDGVWQLLRRRLRDEGVTEAAAEARVRQKFAEAGVDVDASDGRLSFLRS